MCAYPRWRLRVRRVCLRIRMCVRVCACGVCVWRVRVRVRRLDTPLTGFPDAAPAPPLFPVVALATRRAVTSSSRWDAVSELPPPPPCATKTSARAQRATHTHTPSSNEGGEEHAGRHAPRSWPDVRATAPREVVHSAGYCKPDCERKTSHPPPHLTHTSHLNTPHCPRTRSQIAADHGRAHTQPAVAGTGRGRWCWSQR